jgi:hypothetical protein
MAVVLSIAAAGCSPGDQSALTDLTDGTILDGTIVDDQGDLLPVDDSTLDGTVSADDGVDGTAPATFSLWTGPGTYTSVLTTNGVVVQSESYETAMEIALGPDGRPPLAIASISRFSEYSSFSSAPCLGTFSDLDETEVLLDPGDHVLRECSEEIVPGVTLAGQATYTVASDSDVDGGLLIVDFEIITHPSHPCSSSLTGRIEWQFTVGDDGQMTMQVATHAAETLSNCVVPEHNEFFNEYDSLWEGTLPPCRDLDDLDECPSYLGILLSG